MNIVGWPTKEEKRLNEYHQRLQEWQLNHGYKRCPVCSLCYNPLRDACHTSLGECLVGKGE